MEAGLILLVRMSPSPKDAVRNKKSPAHPSQATRSLDSGLGEMWKQRRAQLAN
jgi:hypothetical protein